MKKFLVLVSCLALVFSLSIPAFALTEIYPEVPEDAELAVPPEVDPDFEFMIGTTGGGIWFTSSARCLLASILYFSAGGYPSMEQIMRLENQVYDLLGDYAKWWLQQNGYKVLDNAYIEFPGSVQSFINYALRDLGSSIRIPSGIVGLSRLDSFEGLNLVVNREIPFLLNQKHYDNFQVTAGDKAIMDTVGNFNTYFAKTNDFFTRLDISIFSEIQSSLNTLYRDNHYIQQQVLNPIMPTKPVGADILEEVDKAEDALITGAQASIYRGRDFMSTGVNLLANYGGEFAFVVALFEAFYNIAVIKTLCIVGFALGFFAFCINLVGDGASSLRSAYKSAKKSSSSKKGE